MNSEIRDLLDSEALILKSYGFVEVEGDNEVGVVRRLSDTLVTLTQHEDGIIIMKINGGVTIMKYNILDNKYD